MKDALKTILMLVAAIVVIIFIGFQLDKYFGFDEESKHERFENGYNYAADQFFGSNEGLYINGVYFDRDQFGAEYDNFDTGLRAKYQFNAGQADFFRRSFFRVLSK